MGLIDCVREVFVNGKDFEYTKNYYFDKHICFVSGLAEKINLKFKLQDEQGDNIVLIGMCPKCNKVFYHEDFKK